MSDFSRRFHQGRHILWLNLLYMYVAFTKIPKCNSARQLPWTVKHWFRNSHIVKSTLGLAYAQVSLSSLVFA